MSLSKVKQRLKKIKKSLLPHLPKESKLFLRKEILKNSQNRKSRKIKLLRLKVPKTLLKCPGLLSFPKSRLMINNL